MTTATHKTARTTSEFYPTARLPFTRITDAETFTLWAKTVNESNGNAHLCDLQDMYARSDRDTLIELYTAPDGTIDRRLITFGVYKAMGDDALFTLLKKWARNRAEAHLDAETARIDREHAARTADLDRRERALTDGKRAIYRRIKDLTQQRDRADRNAISAHKNAAALRTERAAANHHANQYATDALKYRQIRSLLTDNVTATAEHKEA